MIFEGSSELPTVYNDKPVSGWWDKNGPGALGIKPSTVAAECLEIMNAVSPSAVHLHI